MKEIFLYQTKKQKSVRLIPSPTFWAISKFNNIFISRLICFEHASIAQGSNFKNVCDFSPMNYDHFSTTTFALGSHVLHELTIGH